MSANEAGDAAPPLLQTKLHAPRRRRGVVERPRLTDRLVDASLPSLTIVAAPAGFGKTTVLAEWFTGTVRENRTTAWLSLDANDSDPTVFWSYVIASVQTVVPGAGRRASALLQSSQPLEAVVASLLNDLTSLEGEIVLVLDDYHLIESAPLHETVVFLLEHLPPQAHLVLGTRADPPLPLARLRARGDLLEIRAADLRFTADETAAYLNDAMGLHLTGSDVDALEARTEGWIAALQLAALSMQGRDDTSGFIASFAGDDRFVVDYLAEEVLERQTDEVRRFLLDTAIMDRFTGALCDAVTGRSGGKAMLERLDRANLFLVPLDDRRVWYRYHHLFADVLRARLADEEPEQRDELHRRASTWFEASGDQPEAIAHAMAGHDVERAARLIELAAPALFRTRQEATALRWLTALPPELFPARPVLSIELVAATMVSGEIDGVEPLLDDIERWLDPGADLTSAIVFEHDELAHLAAQVAVYRAALALIAGDPEGTIEHANRALDLAEASDHLRRGSAAALVGLALWTVGDVEAASRRYTESIASLTAAGNVSDVLGCTIALADMYLTLGRLGDAIRAYEAGVALAEAHGALRGTADMHTGLAEVLLEQHDVGAAADHLAAGALLGERAGLPQNPYRRRVAMARLRRAEGDLDAALDLLHEAEGVYNTDMSPPVRPVAAVRARALVAAGDLAAAQRWVAESRLTPDDDLTYVREYEHLTLARVLVAADAADRDSRSVDDATRLLQRLLAAAEAGRRTGSAVEILIVLALAHQARGDTAAASAALEDALVRAGPEGFIRAFVDELPALAPLLGSIAGPGVAHDHARTILAAAPPAVEVDRAPPVGTSPSGLVDELSHRELDVLRLLRTDLSGPDIARELVVSLNTVRTHTKNIYTKLGVNNRREAVRRAAELGL
jgi:LuxR family transcriptional regulator, maltose regulon positive regulatory protein